MIDKIYNMKTISYPDKLFIKQNMTTVSKQHRTLIYSKYNCYKIEQQETHCGTSEIHYSRRSNHNIRQRNTTK